MPARQRRPVLDDISCGPQNPALIDMPGHIIVRAENVKVFDRQLVDHEVDGLLRCPRGGGLFGAAFGGQSGKDETGDEKMRAKPGVREIPQFMLQSLRESLHAGLGNIVGGISGRRRDALLRTGIDDEAGASALDHAGDEDLRAIDDTPQIDADYVLPVRGRSKHSAARLHAGIIHQNVDTAEPLPHRKFQFLDIVDASDIGRHRHDTCSTIPSRFGKPARGTGEPLFTEIRDTYPQAQAREFRGSRKADARRAASDDSNGIWGQRGMGQFVLLYAQTRWSPAVAWTASEPIAVPDHIGGASSKGTLR